MNGKFIFASILMASSAAVFSQTASRLDHGKATPQLYQCVVTPVSDGSTAPRAVKEGGHSSRWKAPELNAGSDTHRSARAVTTGWDRIDLEFAIAQPSRGQTVPTVSGHAIKTKGTGTSGRMSAPGRPGSAATVTCAGGVPASGEGAADGSVSGSGATRKVYVGNLPFSADNGSVSDSGVARSVPQGPAPQFTCSVSGTIERPQFTIGMWTRPIVMSSAGRQGRAEWSFGASNSGIRRKSGSIIMMEPASEGDTASPSSRIPCSSETAAMRGAWFVAAGDVDGDGKDDR